jgi:phosphoenolpyruvate synthase/pyruvate phosphate dikinase
MVTDQEVMERRGLGLLVESPFLHSTSIWSRSNQVEQLSPKEATETRKAQLVLPEMFDPELMPEGRLLEHALSIENIPHEERGTLEHHLTELKVVLIRRLISDQLAYINIAKKWFKVKDLAEIYRRKIGLGRIGGKAAGMLLAANILKETMDDTLRASLSIPESFFLGSDVMYIFLSMNGLMYWNDQKYKPEVQIREEYPRIIEYFEAGSFPPEILIELRDLLAIIGEKPLIVRSSSLLEDNFGTAFAGKYDSHFCPNQGSIEENLKALTLAIARTYASTLKPDALLYRRSKGLQDYDERMAVLIQIVEGERYRQYYLPFGAGVAFSRNLYRWSPQIRKEDGYVRLVWGLGTRAVQRVGNDYPRLVALSHPNLLPKDTPEAIRQYSQQYVDLIDLEDNSFKTLPVTEVLKPDYGALRYLTLLEQDGYFTPIRTRLSEADVPRTVITFGELIRRTPFADTLSKILKSLEQHYHSAVDLEFAVHVVEPSASQPEAKITLLQCRPQSYLRPAEDIRLPKDLPEDQVIFSTRFMVPRGRIRDIRYIIYISPEA